MTAIYRRDFKAYFTSPIGYVYLGAFILVMNLVFYTICAVGQNPSLAGVFNFMLTVMMFATPILTMRIFSEDFKQKTDQLLLTAPVRVRDIVLGKFLSALTVFATLLLMTLAWPLCISIFGTLNAAEVAGNYIAVFLVGAAYIAMGAFISALTENQVVAAIGSLGLFVGLMVLEQITATFAYGNTLPAFVIEILSFISIFNRYGYISYGILSPADLLYFASLCAVFLLLTVRAVERRKW